jgi:hypothetical protein
MVDEIGDDDVRVLRGALRGGSPAPAAVERSVPTRPRGTREPAAARRHTTAGATRRLVMRVEAAPVAAWTPESEAMTDRTRLTAFLVGGALRTGRPGLPARDELREGDVFWVILPRAKGARLWRTSRDLAADEMARLLEALERSGAEVWDVTAAARQVMKRLFADAAIARAEERRSHEQARDG